MKNFGSILKLPKFETVFVRLVTVVVTANAVAIFFAFAVACLGLLIEDHPEGLFRRFRRFAAIMVFIATFLSPSLFVTIAWFMRLDQMRRGVAKLGLLWLPAILFSTWTFLVFLSFQGS